MSNLENPIWPVTYEGEDVIYKKTAAKQTEKPQLSEAHEVSQLIPASPDVYKAEDVHIVQTD